MEDPSAANLVGGLIFGLLVVLVFCSPLLVLLVGGLVGSYLERRHFEDLARREQATSWLLVTDLKVPPPGMAVEKSALVQGGVVIAADHFKTLCAKFRKFFGGEFTSLRRMQERARREAVLRMVEQAHGMGATVVCNLRLETSTIAGKRHGVVAGCEILASGTALFPPRDPS